MTRATSFRKLQPGLLAAALALSAYGLAYADNFVGTDFGKQAQMANSLPTPPAPDYTGYHKLNLSVLGDTAWAPDTPRGAQGPMRDDSLNAEAKEAAARRHEMDLRIGLPIGIRYAH